METDREKFERIRKEIETKHGITFPEYEKYKREQPNNLNFLLNNTISWPKIFLLEFKFEYIMNSVWLLVKDNWNAFVYQLNVAYGKEYTYYELGLVLYYIGIMSIGLLRKCQDVLS